jgi:sec-independent protein translocase protein TatA
MFGLGFPEIVIILIVVVVLFSGAKKLPEMAKALGKFTGEFKKGKMEIEKEIKEVEEDFKGKDSSKKDEEKK